MLESRGGLGKSHLLKETTKEDFLELSSHLTPLALYRELFHYSKERNFKNINLLIDDCDGLETNSLMVSLLKRVSESEKKITMHYHSSSIIKEGLPETYDLENVKITIICNSFKELYNNKMNIKALSDRFVCFLFNPDSKEIFKYLESWGEDIQALNFLKKYFNYSSNFSLRSYLHLIALKKYVKDWEDIMKKDLCIDEVEYVLNSNIKDSEKVLKISEIRGCSIRNAQYLLQKRKGF